MGNGTTQSSDRPLYLGDGFVAVAAGYFHSLALRADGTLWAWGVGEARLGLGPVGHQTAPRQVMGDVVQAFAGAEHSLALKSDGSLWAWGDNAYGQLGVDLATSWTPVQVGSARYRAAAAGYRHSLAIQADGSLWAWGSNDHGQLGDGTTIDRRMPVRIGEGFRAVAAGGAHSLALKEDGSLWAWGYNQSGQVGNGSQQDVLRPTRIGEGFVAIAAGQQHSLAIKSDGSLWGFGGNYVQQFGLGRSESFFTTPVRLGENFIALASGPAQNHGVAVKHDGTVLTWGSNDNGQLGDGTLASAALPINVVNEMASANLDLLLEVANEADSSRLPFYLKARNSGFDLKSSLSDARVAGLVGEIYFTALLLADSPLLGRTRTRAGGGMVSGVFGCSGFKQTGGSVLAEPAFSGNLGSSGEQSVYTTRSGEPDPLENSQAVICMGVATPKMSAKG